MAVFSSNRNQTLYAQLQADARTITNTSGTWTTTGTEKVRFNSFTLTDNNALNTPSYKTGRRSPLLGVRGRQSGTFNLTKPLFPSGSAGTIPDDDPILQSMFGGTPTIVSGTSVTYNLTELWKHLFFVRYNKSGGTSPTNVYVLGGIPQTVRFTGGGDFLTYSIDGSSIAVGDSVNFPSYTAGEVVRKGTLTAFPAEPTVSTNGNIIPGFGTGAGFKFDGTSVAEVRGTAEISFELGVEAIDDGLNDPYTIGFIGGARYARLSNVTCIDSDSSILNSLKSASYLKDTHAVTMQFGNVPGSIITFTLNNVQLGGASWQEQGAALNIQFGQSDAHASSASVSDDFSISFT